MNKICTTIEQSKKLMELGIDVNTADMFYLRADIALGEIECYPNVLHREDVSDDIPAWSLTALLEIIRNNGRYEMQMYEGGYYFEANGFMTESYFNPIDACYEMILKLHEQKLL